MKRVFISVLAAIILAPITGQITVNFKGPFGEMAQAEDKLLLADNASEEGEDPEERDPKI